MLLCVTMSKKVYKMQSSTKSRVLTYFFFSILVLARDGILLNDFHAKNDAFRCGVYERKIIWKFKNGYITCT